MHFNWAVVSPALPEIFLATVALALLMVGVFSPAERAARSVAGLATTGLIVTLLLLLVAEPNADPAFAFPYGAGPKGYFFVQDGFAFFAKVIILLASSAVMVLSGDYLERLKIHKFEYYVLLTLSTLGMMVLASANTLLTLYLGLELMSFCLYILGAFQRDNLKSTEAGLKYFVLGSLASGLLLYGISLLYGLSGDISFSAIASTLAQPGAASNPALMVAMVMVISALTFKISAVPFHMWTPDVYEGSPTPVTAFMAAVPKVAAFVVLMRVLWQPFGPMEHEWSQMIAVLAVLTMAVGTMLAIVQQNIKRLLAYSSIGHVGFMLVGLVGGTVEGVRAVLVYLAIYSLMTLGTFGVLLMLRRRDVFVETLDDVAGLSRQSSLWSLAMLVFMFSLAGVPPLAGFFAKFYVFSAAVNAGYTWLAVVGVLFSVIGAYYCLRVVKVMYFDEGNARFETQHAFGGKALVVGIAIAVVGFAFLMNGLDAMAGNAVKGLTTPAEITVGH